VKKLLDQEEIDAMVRTARGEQAAGTGAQKVTSWDITQGGQIGSGKLRGISLLHENFARNLTHALGGYLRAPFEATLVSAEHLSFKEFLQRFPEGSYLAACKLSPITATALLQLDMTVAFPIIDLLLGGEGKTTAPTRAMSDIEEQILEGVIRIVCRELQSSWQAIALEFSFDQRQDAEQAQHLMPPEEKTLSLSFEVHLLETRGTLNLAIPAIASHALLRKIAAQWEYQKPRGLIEAGTRLRNRLLGCPFRVDLSVTSIPVPVRDLLDLSPGKVLVLRRTVERPATLLVAGNAMFSAAAARRGDLRAAHLHHALESGAEET
jgi:flagellar motor switch protein FliM